MVDLVYKACTKDNLILSCGFEAALYTVNILDFLFVELCFIFKYQTQSGCTVLCTEDVILAADISQYFLGDQLFLLDNPIKKGVDVLVCDSIDKNERAFIF